MHRIALLPALSLLLMSYPLRGYAQEAKPAAKPKAKPTKAAKSAAPKKEESPVLARIGTATVTQADLNAFMENLSQEQRMQLQYSPGGIQHLVKNLAEMRLVAEKAKLMKLEQDSAYRLRLDSMKTQLLARAFLEKKDAELRKLGEVSADEVKAFYEAHKDRFTTPATFDVRHILIAIKPQGAEKDRTEEELKTRVKEVQDALAAGKSFEDLAAEYTDDGGSKASKGFYAGMSKAGVVPEFGDACMKQEIGKVGEPVKTMYGYHLIRVEKRTESAVQPFEAAQAKAKQMAEQEKGQRVWNDLVESLKKEISFEILPPPAPKAPAPAAKAPAEKPQEEAQ